jgi:hypothetical protein
MSESLNLDVSSDHARALHRVVRAMHDGNCPKCGYLASSPMFEADHPVHRRPDDPIQGSGHRGPRCGCTISGPEAAAALQAFRPYMLANLEVFEQWRSGNLTRIPCYPAVIDVCLGEVWCEVKACETNEDRQGSGRSDPV